MSWRQKMEEDTHFAGMELSKKEKKGKLDRFRLTSNIIFLIKLNLLLACAKAFL
jgi:hypothetical protein